MTGDTNRQAIRVEFPEGLIDIQAENVTPPLINRAQGFVYFLGVEQFEYALTAMVSDGKIEMGNNTYSVTGRTWFDRQWVKPPTCFQRKASRIPSPCNGPGSLLLDNNANISVTQLWEFDRKTLELVATAAFPNGTHVVGAIEPSACPTSGQIRR